MLKARTSLLYGNLDDLRYYVRYMTTLVINDFTRLVLLY